MDAVATTPAVGVGTTLEILAPYLPYGIEVEHPGCGRGVLATIHTKSRPGAEHLGHLVVDYGPTTEHGQLNRLLHANQVLPVLRPFAALCDPLPDGTVPAVEVARLALANNQNLDFDAATLTNVGGSVAVKFSGMPTPVVLIAPTYTVCWLDSEGNYNPALNMVAIVDYLRGVGHFAVGLEPHQYIPLTA